MNDRSNREFTYYPGFIDRTVLLPDKCVQACSVLGYSYAAIESGQYCFCKMGTQISASTGIDTNCQMYTCPGDSLTYCGSDDYLLVYYAGGIVTVS